MNVSATATAKGGIGFTGLLQIVFIVLKLCGVIKWNWALVLLPAIIDASVFVIFLIIIAIVFFVECIKSSRG